MERALALQLQRAVCFFSSEAFRNQTDMIPRGRQQKSGDPLFFVSFVPEMRFSRRARSENAFVQHRRPAEQTASTALLSVGSDRWQYGC
jgi:hypothetical protein